jgi:thiol:disulfide interchange protein DsbD
LAAALVAFRSAGTQLGWGFQLQSPVVVAALAILFFVLALNLSGVFEIRQLVPSSVAGWNARNAYVNDALSGVLAVVIASPCSAPFMGASLRVGQIRGRRVSDFHRAPVGMALPYVLLAHRAGGARRSPARGWSGCASAAFPLYVQCWLAWVLGAQLDNNAVARLGAVLLGRTRAVGLAASWHARHRRGCGEAARWSRSPAQRWSDGRS